MSSNLFLIDKNQVEAFEKLLQNIDSENLSIEDYPKRYLIYLLAKKKYFIEIYASILNLILKSIPKQRQDICLIDYGAGNGLLGLFAKFCGFKKVILLDMNEEFCVCQKELSQKLDLPVVIICGNVEALQNITNTPDAIVGTDVIEHIYNLDTFFSGLTKLNKNIVTVFTTASNDENPIKKRALMKIQYKDEWIGWDNINNENSILSFRKVREKIILQTLPHLQRSVLNDIVKNTRGLNEKDIKDACIQYSQKNVLPEPLTHPTNTCDPLSGSWTEKLISFKGYQQLYKNHGFDLNIKKGYYNEHQFFFKGALLRFINFNIKLLGKQGIRLSPFIILLGKPAKRSNT